MSWRAATGRDTCNRCRQILPEGAEVWRGDVVPSAWWCAACAESLGHPLATHLGPVTPALAESFPAFAEAMRALKARAGITVVERPRAGGDE